MKSTYAQCTLNRALPLKLLGHLSLLSQLLTVEFWLRIGYSLTRQLRSHLAGLYREPPLSFAPMYPIVLRLGPLTIYSYGLMMAIAFLTAAYLTGKELSRKGFDGELASSMVFWAAVGGLVGARILAIIDDWSGFVSDPVHSIFSGSGFVFYGGLIGGFIAVSWTIYRHGLPWLATVDCIAPGLVLAHGIGRIGCQLAGDG